MPALIKTLIDRADNFEIVRDSIAAMLLIESAGQQALAASAGRDAKDWRLRIFLERSTPWSVWQQNPQKNDLRVDVSPIVNVSYSRSGFDRAKGDIVERQASDSTFNIDCYGYGLSRDDNTGHVPGDKDASMEAQRAARLVRSILMAAAYVDMQQRGVLWQRWVSSIEMLSVQTEHAMQRIECARIAFDCTFNEFSPQNQGVPLSLISTGFTRAETGEVFLASFPNLEI